MKKPAALSSEISPAKAKKISRRGFMQIVAVAGAAGALWQFGVKPAAQHVVRRGVPMMGTFINLTVIGPDRDLAEAALDATLARMHDLESRLSRFDRASEVSQLNRTGVLVKACDDLRNVLNLAASISEKTAGAFDVTVLPLLELHGRYKDKDRQPSAAEIKVAEALVDYRKVTITGAKINLAQPGMAVTLDGIAKGYVVDRGVDALQDHGFSNVFVEAGGDLMASGRKAPGRPWQVGIRNPRPEQPGEMVTVAASNRAIATSGDYMQHFTADFSQHHIINPATGMSPPELASASVLAPSVVLADALATAAMVMGSEKSLALLESWSGCEGFFIGKDMARYSTTGFFG